MHKHVVIAGTGPAGLACARAITTQQPGAGVLLLEAGRPFRHRPCPVDRGFACTGCGGVCNVVSGFGGSMHYGDGAKLSLLPSGRRLVDHFGAPRADALCETAFDWLTAPLEARPHLLGQGLSPDVVKAFRSHALSIREYPVAVLGESDLRRVVEGWYEQLAPAVELWHWSELIGAEPDGDGLQVVVRTSDGVRRVSTSHLVLATGRRGVTSTARLLQQLGVEMTDPDISVGIRVEMEAGLLKAIGEEHPDLKITQLDHAAKVKTFCFCGGGNGGRVKFTNYQGAFGEPVITLDGHETAERVPGDRPLAANFGLLCQVQERGDARQARDSFLAAYRKLNGGRPFAQTLGAFLDRTDDASIWALVHERLPFQPSVLDLTMGRVDALFTSAEHASLAAGFQRLMASILTHRGGPAAVEDLRDQVLVIGPELEFLWERPRLDAGCRVPDLPVYVAGDAAGIAQGIVQAAMMGIAAGQAITHAGDLALTTAGGDAR
ncbi:DNA polymerase subunit beta [Streptomyces triculaminicus]|uniref:DNA polymerase subunit beta n=1 Tax=Streptomyces triculaminicus TaxID=2816232 RepID=UPI0037A24AE2